MKIYQKEVIQKKKIKCDYCGKIVERKHRDIVVTRECYGVDLCVDCCKKARLEKSKKTNLEKYGVEFPMQSKEIKKKAKQTTQEHYGCDFSFQNDKARNKAIEAFENKYNAKGVLQVKEFKEKIEETNVERYGVKNPFESQEVKEKIKQTIKEKYGCEYISQSEEIKEKVRNTFLERYGVDHYLKNKEAREKIVEKMLKNGTIQTSSQQLEIFEMCKKEYPECLVYLNKPLSILALDIVIEFPNGMKIDIEYDGWYWHQDGKKDYARDVIVKKYGYKIIRIRSGVLIPTIEQLREAIDYVSQDGKDFSRITLSDWKDPPTKNKNKNKNN